MKGANVHRHLSTIGPVLVIAGLAMQTFLQLMPNYEARPTKTDGEASLRSCTNYTQYIMDPDGESLSPEGFVTMELTGHASCRLGRHHSRASRCPQ